MNLTTMHNHVSFAIESREFAAQDISDTEYLALGIPQRRTDSIEGQVIFSTSEIYLVIGSEVHLK